MKKKTLKTKTVTIINFLTNIWFDFFWVGRGGKGGLLQLFEKCISLFWISLKELYFDLYKLYIVLLNKLLSYTLE